MQQLARRAAAVALVAITAGCVATDDGGEGLDPLEQAETGGTDAQQAAAAYIGLPQDEALAFARERGVSARVGTGADVGQPGQTDDYEVGRLTLVVRDGVVTEVIVETETGPEAVAAG